MKNTYVSKFEDNRDCILVHVSVNNSKEHKSSQVLEKIRMLQDLCKVLKLDIDVDGVYQATEQFEKENAEAIKDGRLEKVDEHEK